MKGIAIILLSLATKPFGVIYCRLLETPDAMMIIDHVSGGPEKLRKREAKKTPGTVSSTITEDSAIDSQHTICSLPSTPKKARGKTRMTRESQRTSTPLRSSPADNLSNISTSTPEAKQAVITDVITQLKVFDISICNLGCLFHAFNISMVLYCLFCCSRQRWSHHAANQNLKANKRGVMLPSQDEIEKG